MIVGIGIDAVEVARMRRALDRTPRLAERVFTEHERRASARRRPPEASLAARFAAKEACRKALGRPLRWQDVEVVRDDGAAPSLRVAGVPDISFHVSLSHTRDLAMAVVVAETV